MERVEGFLQSFDMFAASASLRAKGSSTVTRTSAGVISFILFCYFAYIFIIGILNILTHESITSSQTFGKIPLTSIYADKFMFGVGNLQLDSDFLANQFTIKTIIRSNQQGILLNMTMMPCTPWMWKQLGEDYEQQFKVHYLDKFQCPSTPQKLKLINSTLVPNAIYFEILVEPKNSLALQKFKKLRDYQTNKFNVFYLDQAVIPNQQQAVQYFVNIDHFVFMSSAKQHRTLIRLSNFEILTDYSVVPIITNVETIKGYQIVDAMLYDIDTNAGNQNAKITFQLTNDMYIYNRRVGKIDEMLSYAGGLFALSIWILAFFVASFNQYRYQLMVAETTFNFDKDGHKFREAQFSFWKYIKYSIYVWTYTYFCFKPNWQDCKIIEATLTEANKQMDVTRLFRKLQFVQMALIYATSDSQNYLMALTEPRSIQQVQQQRRILEYYFHIIKGEPTATVQDAIDGNAMRFHNLTRSPSRLSTDNLKLSTEQQNINVESTLRQKMLNSNDQIKQKLIQYLDLGSFHTICDAISKYPMALQQAQNVVLSPELQKVQEHLTQHFLKLKPQAKVKIMNKIPLKIIHRLCLRRQQMENKLQQAAQQRMEYQKQ